MNIKSDNGNYGRCYLNFTAVNMLLAHTERNTPGRGVKIFWDERSGLKLKSLSDVKFVMRHRAFSKDRSCKCSLFTPLVEIPLLVFLQKTSK